MPVFTPSVDNASEEALRLTREVTVIGIAAVKNDLDDGVIGSFELPLGSIRPHLLYEPDDSGAGDHPLEPGKVTIYATCR